MRDLVSLIKAVAASCCAGVFYGAAIGVVLGTLWFPGIGTVFGFFAGSLGGLVFGAIGGLLGGATGWALAGFAGGLIASSCLSDGRPVQLWALMPALVMSAIGIGIAVAQKEENTWLPLLRWAGKTRREAPLLRGFTAVSLVLGVLAALGAASILHERFTAPLKLYEFYWIFDSLQDL